MRRNVPTPDRHFAAGAIADRRLHGVLPADCADGPVPAGRNRKRLRRGRMTARVQDGADGPGEPDALPPVRDRAESVSVWVTAQD